MRKAGTIMALRCSSVRWQSRSDISIQEAGVGRLMTCLCWKSDARPRSPPLPNEGTGDPARRQRRGHLFHIHRKRYSGLSVVGALCWRLISTPLFGEGLSDYKFSNQNKLVIKKGHPTCRCPFCLQEDFFKPFRRFGFSQEEFLRGAIVGLSSADH